MRSGVILSILRHERPPGDGSLAVQRSRIHPAGGGCFRLRVRGSLVEVDLGQARATYRLLEGEALEIEHEGQSLVLAPGEGRSLPVASVARAVTGREGRGSAGFEE